ncbi:MAG: hypothetical protein OEN01_06840, partial [Candidatus Krumholzibacteria bacterium]|nr:hypothetical protein [Candidatus Krumholzibacteria bacterium]
MTPKLPARSSKPQARFGVSLQPEIFYALQVLSAPDARVHAEWKARSLEHFPRKRWPIALPGALWTAVPDAVDVEPTPHVASVVTALETIPIRQFQERILTGMLHQRRAVLALLDDGTPLHQVVASLPRIKR